MIIDPNAVREDGKAGEISVYLVALASGMAGAGYFLLSDKYMKEIPFCFFFMMVCIHLFIINGFLGMIEDSRTQFWSTDPEFGCFGFFSHS